jgi:prophage maintenance system killer protein
MGIFALIIYLAYNGYWLDATNEELFNMTVRTAASGTKEKDQVVNEIESFVEENIIPY